MQHLVPAGTPPPAIQNVSSWPSISLFSSADAVFPENDVKFYPCLCCMQGGEIQCNLLSSQLMANTLFLYLLLGCKSYKNRAP